MSNNTNPNPPVDSAPAPPLDLAQFDGFTPGPWKVVGTYTSAQSGRYGIAPWAEQENILGRTLERRGVNQRTTAESTANARLLAAAPALLAECQRLRAREAALVSALTFAQTEYTGAGVTAAMMRERLKLITEAARAALAESRGAAQ